MKRVLLDLDGVLADFNRQWHNHYPEHPRPDPWPDGVWSICDVHGISWKESCERIDYYFFRYMEWMPDGKLILRLLEEYFGPQNICLSTSNAVDHPGVAAQGKVDWILDQMPDYKHRYFIGANKEFLAHKDVLLIDDKDENVNKFRAAGGAAYLLPRPWNRLYATPTLHDLRNFLQCLSLSALTSGPVYPQHLRQ